MSVIEDTRQALQDFIAPELRAIDARLTALEKRFDQLDSRLGAAEHAELDRFAAADRTEQERFAAADRTEQERFAAAEKQEKERFAAADRTEQERFAAAEKLAAERHERILSELKQLHSEHDLQVRMPNLRLSWACQSQ